MTDSLESPLRGFDRSLPMVLLKAREAVMKKFVPTLREHKLSPQQWRVLRALNDEDGLDISELATRCYLLMPSLSRIVPNLEKRKLLRKSQSAADNRRSVIYLTREGQALYAKIAPKSADRYAYITERFGDEKLERLYELLDELVESLEPAGKDE